MRNISHTRNILKTRIELLQSLYISLSMYYDESDLCKRAIKSLKEKYEQQLQNTYKYNKKEK